MSSKLKIPAIRAKMGDWIYYITNLTFLQVKEKVKKPTEIHETKNLRDFIQRSITDNVNSIKEYILTQEERFFNSLVLAVYDGDPQWIEVELTFPGEEDKSYFNMGFLEFKGDEKIFPVDGQHRVEAIKLALKENNELENEQIGAIFIGHKTTPKGMQRSRRVFSTLNRYAKPVDLAHIIALDEDDIVAIVTRELVEEYELFTNERIAFAKGKNIPKNNNFALTTIITLYNCHTQLLQDYKGLSDKKTKKFLRFRKSDKEIIEFKDYCITFWDSFNTHLDIIKEYLNEKETTIGDKYRNNDNGGYLLFRPIGLLPFVQAAITIKNRTELNFDQIFKKFNNMNFTLNKEPWDGILWNNISKTMMSRNNKLMFLILLFLFDENLLNNEEKQDLIEKYKKRIAEDMPEKEIYYILRKISL